MNKKLIRDAIIVDEMLNLKIRESIIKEIDFTPLLLVLGILGAIISISNNFYDFLLSNKSIFILPMILCFFIEYLITKINKRKILLLDIFNVIMSVTTLITATLYISSNLISILIFLNINIYSWTIFKKLISIVIILIISSYIYFTIKGIIYKLFNRGSNNDT